MASTGDLKSVLDMSKAELANSIKIQDLNGKIRTLEPKKLLAIDNSNIEKDMSSDPTQAYTVERAKSYSELMLENGEADLDKLAGTLYSSLIDNDTLRKQNKGRKPTDAMIKAALNQLPVYVKKKKYVNLLRYRFNLLYDLSRDMGTRAKLLQSLNSTLRAERQSDNLSN